MSAKVKLRTHLYSSVGPVLVAAMSLATIWRNCCPMYGPGRADDHANKMPRPRFKFPAIRFDLLTSAGSIRTARNTI